MDDELVRRPGRSPELHASFKSALSHALDFPKQHVGEDGDAPGGLGRDMSGLPPTPPTLTNSDLAAPREESLASNQEFAEAVRTALRAKASGTVTPTNTHQTPQTPDPSPPAYRGESPLNSAFLTARSMRPSPSMFASINSRTESFHTAHENLDASQASMSRNLSPLSETTQDMTWTDQPMTLPVLRISTQLSNDLLNAVSNLPKPSPDDEDDKTPPASAEWRRPLSLLEFSDNNLEAELRRLKLVSDSPLIRRSLRKSLPSPLERGPRLSRDPAKAPEVTTAAVQSENISLNEADSSDQDVNAVVTTQRDPSPQPLLDADSPILDQNLPSPESLDAHMVDSSKVKTPPIADLPNQQILEPAVSAPLEPPGATTIADPQTENANDMVYREIREENVKRHSAILDGGALRVNIILPKPSPERKLKRTTKHEALRSVSSPVSNGHDFDIEPESRLRHKRATSLKSPEMSPRLEVESHTKRALPEMAKSSPEARRRSHGSRSVVAETLVVTKRRPVSSANHEAPASPPQSQHTLRRFSRESQLENNVHVRRTSLVSRESEVLARKSLDSRFLHTSLTPVSASQLSVRTDVEVCQARGISIFSHNNDSVLVLEHGSLPTSRGNTSSHSDDMHFPVPLPSGHVDFCFQPASPSAVLHTGNEKHSPLTNPRKPPEPPAFRVIPPTPNELERQLAAAEAANNARATESRPNAPPQSMTLKQRARRYSESYILPLFARSLSLRRPQTSSSAQTERPKHLSPLWRPRYFWEEWDSDDDDDDYDWDDPDGEGGTDVLPPGGDTSEPPEQRRPLANKFFPRNMSVRMPGFRGTGGFLVGNSLGLERHGTNNRRHYIAARPSPAVEADRIKRSSRSSRDNGDEGGSTSLAPIRLREKFSQLKADRAERALQRRRAQLRSKIQHTR